MLESKREETMLLLLLTAASLFAGVYPEENLSVGRPLLVSSFASRPPACSGIPYPVVNAGVGSTTNECSCVATNGSTPASTLDWYAVQLAAVSLVSRVHISGITTSFDVLVGYEFAGGMSLNEFSLCARYNVSDNAQNVSCTSPVRGSVVVLRALDDTSQLQLCGVDVFGQSRNMLASSQNISWQMWSSASAPQELPWRMVDGNVSSCVEFNSEALVQSQRAAKFVIPSGVPSPFRVAVYHANVPLGALKSTSCGDTALSLSIILSSSPTKVDSIQCYFISASVASSVAEYECTCQQDCHGELAISPFSSSSSIQQPWRVCEAILISVCPLGNAGTYFPTGAAACTPCPAGTAATIGATTCTQCPAGTAASAGSATCTQCPAGTAAPAGSATCSPCLAGTVSSVGAANCTQCPAGQASDANNACVYCPAGTYSMAGASTCTQCPAATAAPAGAATCTQCLAGTAALAGSATCTPCLAGAAAPAGAATCSVCSAGKYAATDQSSCVDCVAGTSSSIVGATNATTCTVCSAGTAAPAGAATCTSCPAGKYQSAIGQASCVDCVAGTSSSTVGATNVATCASCPAGTYQNVTGQASCASCSAGTYQNVTGQASCANCPAGQTSATGDITCHAAIPPSQKCVRQATIINTSPCTTRRVTSACPLHYDSDKTTYVGTYFDYYGGCGAGPSCACQTGFTYDSGSKRCVRQTTIINTSPCTTSRVKSGCPLHYDSDKTTYVGIIIDYEGGCDASSSCACQTGFTYDSTSKRCVRQATIISTSPCTTGRVLSGCPLHYDSDKTTHVGSMLEWNGGCGAASTCACQPGYDLIVV